MNDITPVRHCSPSAWASLLAADALFINYATMPTGWHYIGCDDIVAGAHGVGNRLSRHAVTEAAKAHSLKGVSAIALAGLTYYVDETDFYDWCERVAEIA